MGANGRRHDLRIRQHGYRHSMGVLTAGAVVEHIGSADSEATVEGGIDIVILAVLYPALEAIVAESGPQLAGKAVVDISKQPA